MYLKLKNWEPAYRLIDLKDATFKIKDGGTNSITIRIGAGNLTYTERANREYTLDRGILDDVRDGDEEPMDVNFDFVWDYIKGSGSGTPSVEDALKQQGDASAWTSSDSDDCAPFAVDIEITYDPSLNNSDCTGDTETITLPDFRYEELSHDIRNAQISCSGRCNAKQATVARS